MWNLGDTEREGLQRYHLVSSANITVMKFDFVYIHSEFFMAFSSASSFKLNIEYTTAY